VFVEAADLENGLVYLRVRTSAGRLEEVSLTVEELEQTLQLAASESAAVVPAGDLALLIEAERIRLAYSYDPHFAVSLSGVEPLPHQLEAVYERMLPQARLRFLLADDPGAGKTIMAGLLIKELKMRNAVERVLVLCPAPLTIQWQDEMRAKFDETFEIIRSEVAKNQLAGNVWARFPQCIASIDFAKQDDVAPELLRAEWDLVIIDEAHKCSARWFGSEVKRTKRYALAEALSTQADRLVLLTATPHSGNPEQFAYFLRLLDADQFVGPDKVEEFAELNQQALMPYQGSAPSPWFLRRIKEELRTFEGEKLFTERTVITMPFELSEDEFRLYQAVTEYINMYLPKQSGRKKAPIALARTVLQRRLASSVRAIRRSLERRFDRFNDVLREVELLSPSKREMFLRQQNLLDAYDEEQDTDDADELIDEAAASSVTAAERIDDLKNEVAALRTLVQQARQLEERGDERKLAALLNCLERTEFRELSDGRGKLLIFTEHRDTLDYLREKLQPIFSVVEIHGGMNAQRRKEAQEQFRGPAVQICLATDAAGEGINLQFCHLMINYDMPWNPMRLEQRMGRIHRIGQKLDVFIFNFVAINTIEGRVLERLLSKLEAIRRVFGERVFDVINLMLKVSDVDLEEILREAAYNPRSLSDDFYLQQIERINPERLRELEQATGVAMATSHVDLGRIRARDYRSEERRLMPEYVQEFFIGAAKRIGLNVERRADMLFRVEHVPIRLRATTLTSVKRFGTSGTEYRKLTFNKRDILHNPSHADAELLSPGHPLFAVVSETLEKLLSSVRGGLAVFADMRTTEPYRLHFFTSELIGEEPAGGVFRTATQYATMNVVLEASDGHYEVAAPDILHDLQPMREAVDAVPLSADTRQKLERFVRGTIQRTRLEEKRNEREREIEIRRSYLQQTFDALIAASRHKWYELADRVVSGENHYRIARDEALRRVDELEARLHQKLEDLKHLRVLRPGTVRYLGSAHVIPVGEAETDFPAMHSDPEVERRAMEYVLAHERTRGWTPEDVSKLKDGSGFDIRSLSPIDANGKQEVRRIEVKGRSGTHQPVLLSANEWIQAGRQGESYWLYVVWGAGQAQTPQLLTIQNPAATLSAQPIIKHYLISADALNKALLNE